MRAVPDPPKPVPIASPQDALLRKDDLLRLRPSDREAFEMGWNAGHARGGASVPPVTCECNAVDPVVAPPVPVAEAPRVVECTNFPNVTTEGTPRTWTLNPRMGVIHKALKPVGAPRAEDLLEVVELAPVLDLLERVEEWLQVPDYQSYDHVVTAKATLADVQALLRASQRAGRAVVHKDRQGCRVLGDRR